MRKYYFPLAYLHLIVFFFILSPSSSFAVMKGLSTEELTAASGLVIEGEVENTEALWSKDGKIFTRATVVVNTMIKGNISQQKIPVEYDGGEIGDIGMRVSDQAPVPLDKGEKVLLFLKAGKGKKDGDAYNIVGKGQGKYRIDKKGIASKSGFTIAGPKGMIDNNIPVDQLIEKIRNVKK